MSFKDALNNDALEQYSSKGIRKRYLVSEGELFLIWAEIMQIRKQETREAYKTRFKAVLKDAQEVKLTINTKTQSHEPSIDK